jgi:hypothetical protein
MKNIFDKEVTLQEIKRVNNLSAATKPTWGKMSVSQMLAHCAVTYEMVFTDKYPKPNAVTRWILKMFVKNIVVSEKPFAKNGKTAAQFIISDEREFEEEKKRLITYMIKTQELGDTYFEGKESNSFGKLTSVEWNNSFYKHLNHHLTQFGV